MNKTLKKLIQFNSKRIQESVSPCKSRSATQGCIQRKAPINTTVPNRGSAYPPQTSQESHQRQITPKAPPVFRPNSIPKVLQPPAKNLAQKGVKVVQQKTERSIVQPFASRVVQAVKMYPNLHPGAVEPVDAGNVFRLNSFANQYRLHKVNSHSVNVPNQQYNFVRTREGEMLLHARYRHPSIAEGKQVLYAGEVFFNNGQLEWWSNGSGHYQPYAEDAEQANLPMDHFFSYQQVIKGEHKRKRS